MAKTTTAALCLLLTAVLATPCLGANVNDKAPEWTLETVDGREIDYPAISRGKVSILFFWATWCPYCHAVMPYLQKLKQDYADHGVEVYAIDFKDDGDPGKYMQELGYDFEVLPIGDLVADDYDVRSAPGLFVVDEQGIIRYRRGDTKAPPGTKIAEFWDGEMRAVLGRLLNRH